ncbi:MAG: hypothetical protein KBC42_01220 [Candidatus Pacebacteria bacterium]|nr:hypothetical protein [Candidatus Paceibacterota bacterium]MBP9780526.1 hypothetical protein [Candidatus Paceibacterota bacterium]
MEIAKETVDFLHENLHQTRAEYYINLFKSMSQIDFDTRIKKYCFLASERERKHFLGKLDTVSALLLIAIKIMEKAIQDRKLNLRHSNEVGIYASQKEILKARSDYEEAESQISKAAKDYWRTRKKLYQNIKECFNKELPLLLESGDLLKTPADFYYQNSGYDFTFYGQDIYVINWYPMGGD